MIDPSCIYIVGVGLTPVGEHWQTSLRSIALEAIHKARADAPSLRPSALYVANMLAPSLSGQAHLGSLLSDFAGLRGIEAVTVEAAGASGGLALRQAVLAMAAGAHDVALVVGAEKITDQVGPGLDSALMASGDSDYEASHGLTPTALAALRMRRYLYEFEAPSDALAGFSRAAHAHALTNPNAFFHKAISDDDYRRAPMVSARAGRSGSSEKPNWSHRRFSSRFAALRSSLSGPGLPSKKLSITLNGRKTSGS